MKDIIYDAKREKNIRDTDRGVILKLIDRRCKMIMKTKKQNRPTAIDALREIARCVRENKPK